MKHLLHTFLLILIFTGFGCWQNAGSSTVSATGKYISFTLNTHDFVYSQDSIDLVNRILDLHEQYDVPIDIFLNDPIVQVYEEQAPELLDRLKTSEVVAVSYHTRPPNPFYKNYDTIGLAQMNEKKLYETAVQYLEHAVDSETGLTINEFGGYQLLKNLMGYPPPVVGVNSESEFEDALIKAYQEKGATFLIVHAQPTELGDRKRGMYIKPEQIDVKLFERLHESPEVYIVDEFAKYADEDGVFLAIKMHDNDFFATDSAWEIIYGKDHIPPFDLSLGETNRKRLSDAQQEEVWSAYAAAVAYAAEHRDEYQLINAFDLLEMIEEPEESVAQISDADIPDVPLYVSFVTHIEEANLRQPNYVKDEDLFWEMREKLIELARMFKQEGVGYNFQSDWTFLVATLEYDHGTESTNGKNIIKYLYEDLGVSIDPHAHESKYNYADVAYLIEQLGVMPSGVVGGYLAYPVEDSKLERLWEPVEGWVYPEYEWTAEVLWGGGTTFHISDEEVDASGVWRPAAADKFHTHDVDALLPNIGAYDGTWDGVDTLLEKLDVGELEEDAVYTATVMIRPEDILTDGYVEDLRDMIRSYDSRAEDGEMAFLRLLDVLEAWETHYNSQPNVLRVEATSQNKFKNRP